MLIIWSPYCILHLFCFPPGRRFIQLAINVSEQYAEWFELLSKAKTAIQLGNKASKIGIALYSTCSSKF